MLSVRLTDELEKKIDRLSEKAGLSKSEIVKEALQKYFVSIEDKESPYELGKGLFGNHGSGKGDLSKGYKSKVKEKIRDKNSH